MVAQWRRKKKKREEGRGGEERKERWVVVVEREKKRGERPNQPAFAAMGSLVGWLLVGWLGREWIWWPPSPSPSSPSSFPPPPSPLHCVHATYYSHGRTKGEVLGVLNKQCHGLGGKGGLEEGGGWGWRGDALGIVGSAAGDS